MKHLLMIAILMLSAICRAGDRDLLDAGEFVEITSKPKFETKPKKDLPGFERLLDRITIEPSSGSSLESFIVSGRVVSANTGAPLERISIFVGTEAGEPRLAGLTNVDGEFKFRLWIKEDHRDLEIQVPKDFSGYLYIGGSGVTFSMGQFSQMTTGLLQADYRRYPLRRLRELSKALKQ
jgi:hypothetical protein